MSHSRLCVLVVEDDEPKMTAIQRFLTEECSAVKLYVASSLTSAVDCLSNQRIDLAIVDMSIPTYDFSKDRAGGGRPEAFGGEDIVRFIESESPETAYVILTQYEQFDDELTGRTSLSDLRERLSRSLTGRFFGVIYYSDQLGKWREDMKTVIETVGSKK
jgi:CheY-like chemotaxis protein